MARKKKHEEHENHERWLISYADFITLLFAFFVVMYSLSSINEGKFRVLASAMAASFQGPPRSLEPIQLGKPVSPPTLTKDKPFTPLLPSDDPFISSPSPISMKVMSKPLAPRPPKGQPPEPGKGPGDGTGNSEAAEAMEKIAEDIEVAMDTLIKADLVKVRRFKFWLEIEINTNILFPSGSAELVDYAGKVLQDIARIIATYPNPVQVEGHTDNVPISTYQYPSNWELSTARATSVVRMLAAQGVAPTRLSAVGHGEFKPGASNDTPEGRRSNRKVVLVILSTETREHQRESGDAEQLATPGAAETPDQTAPVSPEQTAHPENLPESGPESLPEGTPETSGLSAQPVQQASIAGEH